MLQLQDISVQTSRISSAQEPHMTSDYHIGQCRPRKSKGLHYTAMLSYTPQEFSHPPLQQGHSLITSHFLSPMYISNANKSTSCPSIVSKRCFPPCLLEGSIHIALPQSSSPYCKSPSHIFIANASVHHPRQTSLRIFLDISSGLIMGYTKDTGIFSLFFRPDCVCKYNHSFACVFADGFVL